MTALRLALTALHEAAHAVVLYRTAGFADVVSIVADDDRLGAAIDTGVSDSENREHMEARVLSTYAGGHAQRRGDPRVGSQGCDGDEQIAADVLRKWGWEHREQELRDRSAELVEQHWREIEAVAHELLQTATLDDTEVEIIADAAAGRGEFVFGSLAADLAHYRARRGATRPAST